MEADVITKVDIEKRRREIEAEAQAEVTRRKTRGEADAFLIRKQAEGDGIVMVGEGEDRRQRQQFHPRFVEKHDAAARRRKSVGLDLPAISGTYKEDACKEKPAA